MRTAGRDAGRRKRWSAAGILFAAVLAAGAQKAEAGLSVSPLQQEVVIKPGAAGEFALTLTNVARSPTALPIKLRVEVVDFNVDLFGGISFGENSGHKRSAVRWIRLDAREIVLQPDEVRVVHGRISAAQGADGDYWAAMLVTPAEPVREEGVSVILRTASALFVHVARRNYNERLTVNEAEAAPPTFGTGPEFAAAEEEDDDFGAPDGGCSLTVQADIENTGAVSCTASGKAHLYLSGIRKVATIPLHAHSRRVLPGESRRFIGVLAAPLPPGEYSVRVIFTSDTQLGQKAYKEIHFTVDEGAARLWKECCQRAAGPKQKAGLSVNAAEALTLAVQPGRFTTVAIPVSNGGGGTMQVTCRLDGAAASSGWLLLDPLSFTLGPRMRRAVLCRIAVPADTQANECAGNLVFESETACLAGQNGAETAGVPVRITVQR